MIRQEFTAESFWKVIVFYNMDYDFLCHVVREFLLHGFHKQFIEKVFITMYSGEAKAVTCSNVENHVSIVIFNKHTSKEDYLNSIVHEAEHVKQAMLNAYQVEDAGEPPAYTIGYLVSRMWEVFKRFI